MSRKKKNKESEVNTEAWLATYADTITLVLTFFVLLYSYSSIDAIKFQKLTNSLQSVLSGENRTSPIDFEYTGEIPIIQPSQDVTQGKNSETEDIYSKVKSFVEANELKDVVEIKKDVRGVIIELKDNVLFDSARAIIKEQSRPVLDKITNLIVSFPNEIIVEGHTDNVPIHNYEFASNWELSTQRAVNVLKYFVENKGLDPKKFQAAGYGEYRPIATNDTNANRAKNRRVNILIVASEKENNWYGWFRKKVRDKRKYI